MSLEASVPRETWVSVLPWQNPWHLILVYSSVLRNIVTKSNLMEERAYSGALGGSLKAGAEAEHVSAS